MAREPHSARAATETCSYSIRSCPCQPLPEGALFKARLEYTTDADRAQPVLRCPIHLQEDGDCTLPLFLLCHFPPTSCFPHLT